MKRPGHDDPTKHAELLREIMAESFRIGQETEHEEIDMLTTVLHESSRLALQIERKKNGLE